MWRWRRRTTIRQVSKPASSLRSRWSMPSFVVLSPQRGSCREHGCSTGSSTSRQPRPFPSSRRPVTGRPCSSPIGRRLRSDQSPGSPSTNSTTRPASSSPISRRPSTASGRSMARSTRCLPRPVRGSWDRPCPASHQSSTAGLMTPCSSSMTSTSSSIRPVWTRSHCSWTTCPPRSSWWWPAAGTRAFLWRGSEPNAPCSRSTGRGSPSTRRKHRPWR